MCEWRWSLAWRPKWILARELGVLPLKTDALVVLVAGQHE